MFSIFIKFIDEYQTKKVFKLFKKFFVAFGVIENVRTHFIIEFLIAKIIKLKIYHFPFSFIINLKNIIENAIKKMQFEQLKKTLNVKEFIGFIT
jgi:hypothetical protein